MVIAIGLGWSRFVNKDASDALNDAPGLSSLLRKINLDSTPYLLINQRQFKGCIQSLTSRTHLSSCLQTPFV